MVFLWRLVFVCLVFSGGGFFLLAQTPPPPPQPTFIEQAMPFVFIFLLFYLLLIRPATKRHKKQQEFVSQLKKGDQVITASGIVGTIYGLSQNFVTLEVANHVRIKILKSQISSPWNPEQRQQSGTAEKKALPAKKP